MEQTAIEFKNVTKLYGEGETKAVDDISFEIKEGEFITVLGSSGSGKTTTLKMINRLIREDAGNITFFGEDISGMNEVDLRRKIGYCPSSFPLDILGQDGHIRSAMAGNGTQRNRSLPFGSVAARGFPL